MRISDWSSDVCSSDLIGRNRRQQRIAAFRFDQLRTAHPWIEAHQQPKQADRHRDREQQASDCDVHEAQRSEEHTSELQSLMRNSYALFCLKTKTERNTTRV